VSSDWDEVVSSDPCPSTPTGLASPPPPLIGAKHDRDVEDGSLSSSPGHQMTLRYRPSPPTRRSSAADSKSKAGGGDRETGGKKPNDLRSFFKAKPAPVSPLRSVARSVSRPPTATATGPTRKPKRRELEQLQLNIDGASNTVACRQCGMSYAKGAPEDAAIHDKHHRRVVVGVDYAGWKSDVVIRDGVMVPGGGEGRLVMVDGAVEGAQGRKVTPLLTTLPTQR
jgi:hypothetical protein